MSELLTDEQAAESLKSLPGWKRTNQTISRTYEFETYADGLVFAVSVGHAANAMNHHPDLLVGYQKVTVSTTSHDAGGLTRLDFELAEAVDSLV